MSTLVRMINWIHKIKLSLIIGRATRLRCKLEATEEAILQHLKQQENRDNQATMKTDSLWQRATLCSVNNKCHGMRQQINQA